MKVCNGSRGSSTQQWKPLQPAVNIKQDIFKQKEKRAALGSAHDCCKAEMLLLSAWGADKPGQRQVTWEWEQECVKWKKQNNSHWSDSVEPTEMLSRGSMLRLASPSVAGVCQFAAICWQSFAGAACPNCGYCSCICFSRERRHMKNGGKPSSTWKSLPNRESNNNNTRTAPVVLPPTVVCNELKEQDRLSDGFLVLSLSFQ